MLLRALELHPFIRLREFDQVFFSDRLFGGELRGLVRQWLINPVDFGLVLIASAIAASKPLDQTGERREVGDEQARRNINSGFDDLSCNNDSAGARLINLFVEQLLPPSSFIRTEA